MSPIVWGIIDAVHDYVCLQVTACCCTDMFCFCLVCFCKTHLSFICLPISVACSSACCVNNVPKSGPGAVTEKAWRITATYNAAAGGTEACVRTASDGSVRVVVTNSVQCDAALLSSCSSSYQQHHIHTWVYASTLSNTARDIRFTTGHHCVIRNVSTWTFFPSSYQCCLSSSCPNRVNYDRIASGKVYFLM